ncbi:polysaccharide deacetylase family protein [Butyrivibrio fibrisolvens]|uniref:polysaccharide deacetylase family protein n=1 Tax=Butyrivibrio fibrisolvens TaxID=831 RepID=UPI00040CB48B|nr:polysaccharide deacetylase family protein [Butyrivibrio fibrisolvens]
MSSRVFVRRGRNNLRDERRGSWQGPVSVTQGIKGDEYDKVTKSATLSDAITRPFRFSTDSLHKTDNAINISLVYSGDADKKALAEKETKIAKDAVDNKHSSDNYGDENSQAKIGNKTFVSKSLDTGQYTDGAVSAKGPDTKGLETKGPETKEAEVKESDTRQSENQKSDAKESIVKEINTKESNTKESSIKEAKNKEAKNKENKNKKTNTKDLSINDISIKESQVLNSDNIGLKDKEADLKKPCVNEAYDTKNGDEEDEPPGRISAKNFSDIDLDEIKVENASGQWVEYRSLRERLSSFDFRDSSFLIKAFVAVFLVVAIVFFSFQCVILKSEYDRINDRLLALQNEFNDYKDSLIAIQDIADKEMPLSDNQEAVSVVSKNAPGNGIRYVYLTFDDGPSPYTDEILDVLASYDVKATFFVCGKSGYDDMYKRIVDEGHTIGMHSYSHDYKVLYESLDSFQTDLHKIQNYIFDVTGVWTTYYRFPGGSSNTASQVPMSELIGYLDRNNITYFDWNVYGGDNIASDIIVSNVTSNISGHENCMILLHDAGDKEETVEALPKIIEYVESLPNTVIVPVTESTVPVQHSKNQ